MPGHDDLPRRFLAIISRGGSLSELKAMAAERPGLINEPAPHPLWGGTPQPLHVAIERGETSIFDWLLASGADIDGAKAAYDGWTPLMLALHHGRRTMTEALLQRGAAVGLPEALMLGDDTRVEALLKKNPDALAETMPSLASPLRFARTVKSAERLLDLGVSLDRKDRYGKTPLEAIVADPSKAADQAAPLLRFLIERGAEAPSRVYAALGDLARLQAAAEFNPEIARDPDNAHAAIESGQNAVVHWMLTQGLPVNSRSPKGSRGTLLHSAAWHGNLPLVKMLLSHGADATLTDEEHRTTPAEWAKTASARLGRKECEAVAEWLARSQS